MFICLFSHKILPDNIIDMYQKILKLTGVGVSEHFSPVLNSMKLTTELLSLFIIAVCYTWLGFLFHDLSVHGETNVETSSVCDCCNS